MNLSTYNSYPPLTTHGSPYIDGSCSTTINPVFKYANHHGGGASSGGMGSEFDARNFHDFVNSGGSCYEDGSNSPQLVYATQSLDRRKNGSTNKLHHSTSFKEEVILRPLGNTGTFDYINRSGGASIVDMRLGLANNGHHQTSHLHNHHNQPHYMTRTLPRGGYYGDHRGGHGHGSSTQSIRDVAL